MDENGIGTDATIHEHIKKIVDRGYAVKMKSVFKPTPLGQCLIDTYSQLGMENLYKPNLRAEMERKMKSVASGERKKEEVLKDYLSEMETQFIKLEHN